MKHLSIGEIYAVSVGSKGEVKFYTKSKEDAESGISYRERIQNEILYSNEQIMKLRNLELEGETFYFNCFIFKDILAKLYLDLVIDYTRQVDEVKVFTEKIRFLGKEYLMAMELQEREIRGADYYKNMI